MMVPSTNEVLYYDKERMFQWNNLRFDMLWKNEFSAYDSIHFHALAARTEEKLVELIVQKFNISQVKAVKIERARKGSVVVS